MEALLSRNYEGGIIRLTRPLAPGVSCVNVNDPTFSDLAGVLTGVKPVTYTPCSREKLPGFKALCEKLGLKYLPAEKFAGRNCFHMRRQKEVFFIGRDLKTLKTAALIWKNPSNIDRWSGMLGYPACCVRMHSEWLDTMGHGPDLVEMAFRNTARKGKLDFRMNNVYNYSSRVHNDNAADRGSYEKITARNREYVYHALHVIGWHPCSYDCRESLKKAEVIFSFIKHHAPDYAAALTAALAKPVLFWGKYRYAFIDGGLSPAAGYKSGGWILSPAVSRPRSLLDDAAYRRVAFCREIRVTDWKAGFFRDGVSLSSPLAGRPLVLNFVEGVRS